MNNRTLVIPAKAGIQKIKYIFKIGLASCFILIFVAFLTQKGLSQDISLQPDVKNASKNIIAQNNSPPVYLISYADGPAVFLKNQNALAQSAVNKGMDFIFNYRRSHLDPDFVKNNAFILNQKKGAGFWLWKPYVILKTLENMPENAILVYSDAGVVFRNPIFPLIELAKEQDIILFEYVKQEKWGRPINVAKREVFIALDGDTESVHWGGHVWAGFAVFRNTEYSRQFVKRWLKYCQDEKLIMEGTHFGVVQHPAFYMHYHDEAILNVLYNKDRGRIYLMNAEELFEKYATWHHRHSDREDFSLLPALRNDRFSKWHSFQDFVLNNDFVLLIREFLRNS